MSDADSVAVMRGVNASFVEESGKDLLKSCSAHYKEAESSPILYTEKAMETANRKAMAIISSLKKKEKELHFPEKEKSNVK